MRAVGYIDSTDVSTGGSALFPPDRQRDLIRLVAATRGLDVDGLYERTGGPQSPQAQALGALAAHRADVLIASSIQLLGSTRADVLELLARSRREGWELIVLDVGIDTTSRAGRSQAEATRGSVTAGDQLLCLPPADLRLRVTGSEDASGFALSGIVHLDMYERLLRTCGYELTDFRSILDFGGGPGRVARHLKMRTRAAVSMCDIDEPAVTWVQDHLPGVDARVSQPLPPLPFAGKSFDLVLCFSVFTHLDEDYQNAWLSELERVTAPGGIVVATVHGESSWQDHRAKADRTPERWAALDAHLRTKGFLHVTDDSWERYFPDFYHTSFHQAPYIRSHWSRWFEVRAIDPGPDGGAHDFVVLRRRAPLARVKRQARAGLGDMRRRLHRTAGAVAKNYANACPTACS